MLDTKEFNRLTAIPNDGVVICFGEKRSKVSAGSKNLENKI